MTDNDTTLHLATAPLPFDPTALVARIQATIARHAAVRAAQQPERTQEIMGRLEVNHHG